MADTQRTVSAILALLANNTSGDISPQDLRDAMVSWRPGNGCIYVPAAAAAAITIADTTNYVECTAPAWTLAQNRLFDESDGNGRLTYIGTETVYAFIQCSVSLTAASNNQVMHWRLGKNGTSDAATEVQRKVGTGADVGALAIVGIMQLTTGDHVSLFVRNSTAIVDPTIQTANLMAHTAPT